MHRCCSTINDYQLLLAARVYGTADLPDAVPAPAAAIELGITVLDVIQSKY